jgi:lycopene cyclase domain-containing protein
MAAEYFISLLVSACVSIALYLVLRRREWRLRWGVIGKLVAIEVGMAFLWDLVAVWRGWWSFTNPQFLVGVYVLWLPVEEVLFFVAVTVGVVILYEYLLSREQS